MKNLYSYICWLLLCFTTTVTAQAQSANRYTNSLRFQYGLYQYNANQHDFINSDGNNFLSAGLTYRHQFSRVSGLNITGRYYQWQLKEKDELKTYAAQAMWVLHARRVGTDWHINRFTPYAGIGLGVEKHHLLNSAAVDSAFSKFYIPVEAGILFNLSSRWSIGMFAEYKFSTAADIKKLAKTPEGKLDIINAAGISLAWHFGKLKKTVNMPVVYTHPISNETTFISERKRSTPDQDTIAIKKAALQAQQPTITDKRGEERVYEKTLPQADDLSEIALLKADSTPSDSLLAKRKNIVGKEAINQLNADLDNTSEATALMLPASDSLSYAVKTVTALKMSADKKIDTLLNMVQQLNERINVLTGQSTEKTSPNERIVIQPVPIGLNDEPVISRIKQSYNQLGRQVEDNYRQGNINEGDLQRLRNETDRIKNNLTVLSKDDEIAFEELATLYNSIASLRNDMTLNRETAITSNRNYLEKDLNNLQYKLDKTLLELEYIKQNSMTGGEQTKNKDVVQLTKTQQALEKKVAEIEKQNQQLKNIVERQMHQRDTIKKTTVNKEGNILLTIKFKTNSYELQKEDKESLLQLAPNLANKEGHMFLLSGFADKSGNAEYNKKLSQKRVEAVKKELVKLGLKKEIILERYFGSDKATDLVSENDRKVVIRLLNQF